MTYSEINNRITFLTGQNTTSFTEPDRLASVKQGLYDVMHTELKAAPDFDYDSFSNTTIPLYKTTTKANQQDYELPSNLIEIKRVEVSYDGSSVYRVEPFDINQRSRSVDASNISDFLESEPFYDKFGNSIMLYPIPKQDVDKGLRIWISRTPVTPDSMSDATPPGFNPLYHEILVQRAVMDWSRTYSKEDFRKEKAVYDEMLFEFGEATSRKEKDQKFVVTGPGDNYSSGKYHVNTFRQ